MSDANGPEGEDAFGFEVPKAKRPEKYNTGFIVMNLKKDAQRQRLTLAVIALLALAGFAAFMIWGV